MYSPDILILLFFLFAAVLNGLGLILILNISKKHRSLSGLFLSLILYSSLMPFMDLLFGVFELEAASDLVGIIDPPFADGPLIWLYVQSLLREKEWAPRRLLHFIPALLILLLQSTLFPALSDEPGPIMVFANTMIEDLYTLSYIALSAVALKQFSAGSRNIRSTPSSLGRWLAFLLLSMTLIRLYSLSELFWDLANRPLSQRVDEISLLLESLVIQTVAILNLLRPDLFTELKRVKEVQRDINETDRKEKYGENQLPPALLDEYTRKLRDLMEREKPFLSPDLSLGELADSMALSPHDLSQLINTGFQTNFYTLINGRRVEEAKSLLNSRDATILEIAFLSGFNSKTTFNVTFKKMSGMTPSEYRKKRSP